MASTWTTNNAIEKIADGEKTDTWGQITNRNFDIVDQAINGVVTISLGNASTYDLDTDNGTTTFSGTVGDAISDGVNKVLVFTSTGDLACDVNIEPNNVEKIYFINNTSTKELTISQGSGSGETVTLSAGAKAIVYCNGAGTNADVVEIAKDFDLISDITTIGTSQAEKAVTADVNGDVYIAEEFKAKSYNETYNTLSSYSGSVTMNSEDGNVFAITLSENITTFNFSNSPASGTAYAFSLKVTQDASASGYTIAWPAAVDWPNGTAPTLTSTASAVDQFVFYTHDNGTTWYGFVAGQALG